MSVAADIPRESGFILRLLGSLKTLIIGTLLCMTPVTAVLVLGWLMRRMRFVAHRRAGIEADRPGWILGSRGGGWIARLLGGLALNVRTGLGAAFALLLATLPFTALGHVVGGSVERAYRRTDYLERRRVLMERWASHLVRSDEKVVRLKP